MERYFNLLTKSTLFQDVGFRGPMRPDHVPLLEGKKGIRLVIKPKDILVEKPRV